MSMEGNSVTLVCTVGGSPAPIRTAIARLRPAKVVFVVSEDKDGAPSSARVVNDEILEDGKPGLKHADGCPPAVSLLAVPADDPDTAFARIEARLERLRSRSKVVADYTGGTKSMSSALFLAATAHEGVDLQFMRGLRGDLSVVTDGTEEPVGLPVHLVGLARDFDATRGFVARRDYGAALRVVEDAAAQLASLGGRKGSGAPTSWRKRLALWRDWLRAIDAWDRFRHADTLEAVEASARSGSPLAAAFDEAGLTERLRAIAVSEGKPSFALVEDLWLNALRRAEQGRHDDAVARCYRLVEAAIQARLLVRHGIESSRVPPGRIPPELRGEIGVRTDPKTGEPYVELGLSSGLKVLRHYASGDPLARAIDGDTPRWQGRRNRSILAHGFTALDRQTWQTVQKWFEARRAALWETDLGRPTAPQLPNALP